MPRDTKSSLRFARPSVRQFNKDAAKAAVQKYQEKPLSEVCRLDPKTRQRRERIWQNWEEFAACAEVDPVNIWFDLCLGKPEVQAFFQGFLRQYWEQSVTWRPCLDPEEYEEVHTINCASTIEDVWCLLVNHADDRIMKPKRLKDRENAGIWSLKYASRRTSSTCSPTYEIARWIPEFGTEVGLNLGQTFQKDGATTDDILTILSTVWKKADDIRCSPDDRLSFTMYVVEMGLGGWRPGALELKKYNHVTLAWVRDPVNPSITRTICWSKVDHNKLRRLRIEREQRSSLSYALSVVPTLSLCLTTMFTVRAIRDNAFEAGFTTCDEVLNPGTLEEGVDFVELRWKEEFMGDDKHIMPMNYRRFLDLWNEVRMVLGSRSGLRPYSVRVGAVGRLDGCLQPALRNFIVSHSTEVFERSYQQVRIRANLANIAFGDKARHDAALWEAISNSFHNRDPNAPTRLSKKELDQFESRKDITELRKELRHITAQEGSSSQEAKKVSSRIRYILDCLEKLQVQQKRRKYFEEADKLRAMNQSTTHLKQEVQNLKRKRFGNSSAYAAKLAGLLFQTNITSGLADRLVAYISGASGQSEIGDIYSLGKKSKEPARCLFGCGTFFNTSALTRHVRHLHMHVFKARFLCPECKRMNLGDVVIEANPCAWSSHVRRVHGAAHTPNLESLPDVLCLLCDQQYKQRGFSRHLNTHSELFDEPISCPACLQEGRKVEIEGMGGWITHVADVHGGGRVLGAIEVYKTSCSDAEIASIDINPAEAQHRKELARRRQVDRKRKAGNTIPSAPLPYKRAKTASSHPYAHASGDSDWEISSPDPHADEEFWVDGRE
ncbi:hypothetical protein MAA_08028 [Metarhizium robertsii ARSEF 23]|uniref:FluG domain-containing protein n=1 Tax=Metarhizium robertsii (strain ARSEF 23 / ATCC MYA-3075) TaxID=655844 RepID=E9F6X9_METRA|nr:uncharacterized protein MAA_08028 [Metarhizium robertsii ARSEF 23]EFY96531.2 hypothetical protein MAA_08028 [Metarhizium robertsii ARSEF 23]